MYSLEEIKEKIAPICKQYDVKYVRIFGDYGLGIATEDSKIELQADIEDSTVIKGVELAEFWADLRDTLGKEPELLTVWEDDDTDELFHRVKKEGVFIYGYP